MGGFKLIAIRLLKDCDSRFLKNLEPGEIYKFYNDFEFKLDKEVKDVISIQDNSSVPYNLFGENINVSAIVGKNGSGKSTILELFSLFVFCLSKQLDLINIENFKKNHYLNKDAIKRLETELNSFKLFNCEIYYMLENTIYCISKSDNNFSLRNFQFYEENLLKEFVLSPDNDNFILSNLIDDKRINFLKDSFFYSILANYSLYGLNTNEVGIWLKSIFHKNDGYQTPIVLNPMRSEGIIDINRLTYLSKSRLLTNVFKKLDEKQKEEDSLRNLVNNKIVEKLILKLDLNKFKIVEDGNLKNDQLPKYLLQINEKSIYREYTEKYKKNHFIQLITAFYPEYSNLDIRESNFKKISIEYILRKAFDIIKTYPEYKIYANMLTPKIRTIYPD